MKKQSAKYPIAPKKTPKEIKTATKTSIDLPKAKDIKDYKEALDFITDQVYEGRKWNAQLKALNDFKEALYRVLGFQESTPAEKALTIALTISECEELDSEGRTLSDVYDDNDLYEGFGREEYYKITQDTARLMLIKTEERIKVLVDLLNNLTK